MPNGYSDSGYVDDGYWDGPSASLTYGAAQYSIVVRSKPLMFGRTGVMECIKLWEKTSNDISTYLSDDQDLPVTDATVLLTIVDQNQEPVPGIPYPQTLENLGDGLYGMVLPRALEIVRTENYWAQFASSSPTKGDAYQETLAICVVNRR